MQELDRAQTNDFQRVVEGVTKRHWTAGRVDELPFIMHRAFSSMLSGRQGPVQVEVPMDLQAESADVVIHPLTERVRLWPPAGRPDLHRGGGQAAVVRGAPGHRGGWRSDLVRRFGGTDFAGRAGRRRCGHDLERQGLDRRRPCPERLVGGPDRDHLREQPCGQR